MTAEGSPTSPVTITGLRGIGKTVLLRRAAAGARGDRALVMYTEGSRREPLTTSLRDGLEAAQHSAASLPARLKRGIESVLRALPKPEYELPEGAGAIGLGDPEQPAAKRFSAELRELNEQAHKHDRYLAFIIDEIQEAPAYDLDVFIRFIRETAGTSTPAILIGAGLPNARAHPQHVRTYVERWRYSQINSASLHTPGPLVPGNIIATNLKHRARAGTRWRRVSAATDYVDYPNPIHKLRCRGTAKIRHRSGSG